MLRSTVEKVSAPSDKGISWLNHTPHAAAVYASWPSLPSAHATLTSRRLAMPYLGWTFTSGLRQPPGAFPLPTLQVISSIKATSHALTYFRRDIGGYSRCAWPLYNCLGRPIFWLGSSIISFHWAIQPTVRATAKSTVNIVVGNLIALRVMPE